MSTSILILIVVFVAFAMAKLLNPKQSASLPSDTSPTLDASSDTNDFDSGDCGGDSGGGDGGD